MTIRFVLIIIFLFFLAAVIYFSFYQIINLQSPPVIAENILKDTNTDSYSNKPIFTCLACSKLTRPGSAISCCPSTYIEDCKENNGVTTTNDVHPMYNDRVIKCYQKAPDAGKDCSSNEDCLSASCDLESAVTLNICTLVKKVLSGERNKYASSVEFYTTTYSCPTSKPGVCREAPEGTKNGGGQSHTFEMDGNTLIEVLGPGAIS